VVHNKEREARVKFLADESCDFVIIRALRGAGFDVVASAEIIPGAKDVEVLKKAQTEGRILLTEDKDFGQLVWAGAQKGSGVILLRYPHHARQDISTRVVDFVTQYEDRIAGLFVVIQPDKIRMRKKSGGDTEG